MKKIYIYIGILILLLNFLLVFKNIGLSSRFSDYNKKMEENKENSEIIINELFQKDSLDILLDNMPLKEELKLKDSDNSTITLEKIAKESKIILRLPEFSCTSCFEESLIAFKKFIDRIGDNNVIIISKYENPRDLYMFKRINKFTCSVYNIKEDTGLIAENNSFPFIFFIDESMKTKDLHVIRKGDSKLTEFYLENMFNKYFKNSKEQKNN